MHQIHLLVAFALAVAACQGASAQSSVQAANWCDEAKKNLVDKEGAPIACANVSKRCVLMNNYWCQKHGSDPWRGTQKTDGKDGHRDQDGHAVFESGAWSARAIAIDLRAKYRRGLKTAVSIAAEYSPWCDTLGSKAVVEGRGRTCKDRGAKPSPGFAGPYCAKPEKAELQVVDCAAGCNCPPGIAKVLVKNLNVGINDDLHLFDAAGKPGANLVIVLQNLAFQEQGIRVRAAFIEEGLARL